MGKNDAEIEHSPRVSRLRSLLRRLSRKNTTLAVTTLSVLLASITWTPCESVGIHKEEHEFCYSDPDCGPDSHHWGETCQNGVRQSPISLPIQAPVLPGVTALELTNYRGDSFRMRNNGHTVHLELLGSPDHAWNALGHSGAPGGPVVSLPHPLSLTRFAGGERIPYKFDSAHFHWGVRDDVGSEHCFDDRCFSMEVHLVHHLSNYRSMQDAMDSGDPNALAVIAVMLDVTPAAGGGNPVLAPIVHNLYQIEEPTHEDWAHINMPIDFTPLLATRGQNYMYTYKGSLTTPDCDEQVNWYVFKRPIAISHKDAAGFRLMNDNRGEKLLENHRPIQSRNGRPIFLTAIRPE